LPTPFGQICGCESPDDRAWKASAKRARAHVVSTSESWTENSIRSLANTKYIKLDEINQQLAIKKDSAKSGANDP